MNIVLAGDWHSDVHEQPMADALTRLGHAVTPFAWHTYIAPANSRGRSGVNLVALGRGRRRTST